MGEVLMVNHFLLAALQSIFFICAPISTTQLNLYPILRTNTSFLSFIIIFWLISLGDEYSLFDFFAG